MKGISRRHFCQTSSRAASRLLGLSLTQSGHQYEAMEWSYTSRPRGSI
jgi:hypothetical protein